MRVNGKKKTKLKSVPTENGDEIDRWKQTRWRVAAGDFVAVSYATDRTSTFCSHAAADELSI